MRTLRIYHQSACIVPTEESSLLVWPPPEAVSSPTTSPAGRCVLHVIVFPYAWVSLRALPFICCGLVVGSGKTRLRDFTACFVHGHLSTQVTCLQMPTLHFLKILHKKSKCVVMNWVFEEIRQLGTSIAFLGEAVSSLHLVLETVTQTCSLLTCFDFESQNPFSNFLLCIV